MSSSSQWVSVTWRPLPRGPARLSWSSLMFPMEPTVNPPVKSEQPLPIDLSVRVGNLVLPNPVLTASGTFGYAREMEGVVNFRRLGGIVPKTVTIFPRTGNAPWRTVETSAGLLNSIGLDNDGIDYFLANHAPYLRGLGCPILMSVAGKTVEEFSELVRRAAGCPGISAIELNVSCPNVSGGVDFGANCDSCSRVVSQAKQAAGSIPIIAKLTPNVADVASVAAAAEGAGADAITLINTCLGMAVDWRKRRPLLGNVLGGLSGPAIKPIALRCVYQAAQRVKIPILAAGGIANIHDAMEFFVAGASAIQVGTANFYNPIACIEIVDALPFAIQELGANSVQEIVGTLQVG